MFTNCGLQLLLRNSGAGRALWGYWAGGQFHPSALPAAHPEGLLSTPGLGRAGPGPGLGQAQRQPARPAACLLLVQNSSRRYPPPHPRGDGQEAPLCPAGSLPTWQTGPVGVPALFQPHKSSPSIPPGSVSRPRQHPQHPAWVSVKAPAAPWRAARCTWRL